MNVLDISITGLIIIEPSIFRDKRGYFVETYHQKKYSEEMSIHKKFVQDNLSHSVQGTLRGLHYQLPHSQAKLINVVRGSIYDVVVDIRRESPTFGQWLGIQLSEEDMRQLYVPEGIAHGFCVLSEIADVIYRCSDFYYPENEGGVFWNDPDLGIEWPVENPILSEKDRQLPHLKDIPLAQLPIYEK
jgi:dTDP-4-dehydrorhamnose 3,5-epimerase